MNFERDAHALLRMLDANRCLECFELVVLSKNHSYIKDFRKNHLKPIDRLSKLDKKSKLAFLSVTLSGETSRDADRYRSVINRLDQHLVAAIFGFAAPPVLRKVYFRLFSADSESFEDISDSDEYDSAEDESGSEHSWEN
ncbi:hypothetical protein PR003_g16582 [Phytophthora rubi]|uniref:Uncharacterized protein n=1 Tax=Phytophthora rubi TaxID=129364 RepID=A0A6A4EF98_9STRA|nr:hypothetical protein PR003_g16582 [Phytophthora rubi]